MRYSCFGLKVLETDNGDILSKITLNLDPPLSRIMKKSNFVLPWNQVDHTICQGVVIQW
jgi:hypothetical protein